MHLNPALLWIMIDFDGFWHVFVLYLLFLFMYSLFDIFSFFCVT